MPRNVKPELVKPKRAPTAFILFCNDERPKLQKEHPEMKFGELGKHLGELWNACGDKQKKKYTEKSLKEKERYQTEVTDYVKAGGDIDDLKRKRKGDSKEKSGKKGDKINKQKDPAAPKRPKSAYLFFSLEERERLKKEQPSLNFADVGKLVGERWKAINPAVKAQYQKMAEDAKLKYDADVRSYQTLNASNPTTTSTSSSSSSSSPSTTTTSSKKKMTSTNRTPIPAPSVTEDSQADDEDDEDDEDEGE